MDGNTGKEDKLTPQDPPETTTGSNARNSETESYKNLYETYTKKGNNDPPPPWMKKPQNIRHAQSRKK
jgi:hypothetical protein